MTAFVDKSFDPENLDNIDQKSVEDIDTNIQCGLEVVRRIINSMDKITASEDKDEIEKHIKIIEECEIALEVGGIPARQAIREGIGDYKDIHEKCIKFGLV